MKSYYRVDVVKGLKGSKRKYSVSTVNYVTTSKQSAINKAKREAFRTRQKIPKNYKLYYEVIKIK